MAVTKEQVETFLTRLNRAIATFYSEAHPEAPVPTATAVVEGSRKYIRVSQYRPVTGQYAVYCFIDIETGNILKAAGWSGPELKNPRGNIADDRPLAQLTAVGAQYLKPSDVVFPSLDAYDR